MKTRTKRRSDEWPRVTHEKRLLRLVHKALVGLAIAGAASAHGRAADDGPTLVTPIGLAVPVTSVWPLPSSLWLLPLMPLPLVVTKRARR